jgi:hypothetical protein
VKQPQDRLPPRRERVAPGNVRGEGGERLSTYFDFKAYPEKAAMRVTRLELLAVVTQLERNRFWRRVWTFLRRPVGSRSLDSSGTEVDG